MKDKVIVVPGSFSVGSAPALGGYPALDIWFKDHNPVLLEEAQWLIGHSLGASYVLSQNILSSQKVILVNPLIIKRNFLSLVFRDIRFLLFEGVPFKELIPLSNWLYGFRLILKLLKVDVLENLRKLPKSNVFIVRGLSDSYFCDEEDVALARKEGFTVFEVKAGHLGNKAINEKICEIINLNFIALEENE